MNVNMKNLDMIPFSSLLFFISDLNFEMSTKLTKEKSR